MQAIIPGIPPELRDSVISALSEADADYKEILSLPALSAQPVFKALYGTSILILPRSLDDFRIIVNRDVILSPTCSRRPAPFVSKKDIFVPEPFPSSKGCHICNNATHKSFECQLYKKFINSKTSYVLHEFARYYRLGDAIKELDPPLELVTLSELNEEKAPPPHIGRDHAEAIAVNSIDISPKLSQPTNVNPPATPSPNPPPPVPVNSNPKRASQKQTYIPELFKKSGSGNKDLLNYPSCDFHKKPATGGGSKEQTSSTIKHRKTFAINLKRNQSLSFPLIETPPDGNCFFHALLHQKSKLFDRLGHLQPMDIRSRLSRWCETHPDTFLKIIKRTAGTAETEAVTNSLLNDCSWVGYAVILVASICLEVDILLLCPDISKRMLSSDFLTGNKIYSLQPQSQVTLLFHEYGKPLTNLNCDPNHYSLLAEPPNLNIYDVWSLFEILKDQSPILLDDTAPSQRKSYKEALCSGLRASPTTINKEHLKRNRLEQSSSNSSKKLCRYLEIDLPAKRVLTSSPSTPRITTIQPPNPKTENDHFKPLLDLENRLFVATPLDSYHISRGQADGNSFFSALLQTDFIQLLPDIQESDHHFSG
jgi:hypothetical protein